MPSRIPFTKETIAALALPTASKRLTVYDSSIPKLALRITTAGARSFCICLRI
jgi:hypothetical protein